MARAFSIPAVAPRLKASRGKSAAAPKRRLALPETLAPMLATSGSYPPDEEDYSFEIKWDGVRALTFWDGKALRILSRNELDITRRYPELHGLGKALGDRRAILDGEIVAFDEQQRPSFPLLQHRMHTEGAAIARAAAEVPAYYLIFDLLWLDDRSLMAEPFTTRRELLESLNLRAKSWRISPVTTQGRTMLQTARDHQLEGIVAKCNTSLYYPGRRSPEWLKIKLAFGQEFVVGGYTFEKDTTNRLGTILVGYYNPADRSKLHYAGKVGTGFNNLTAAEMLRLLQSQATPGVSPFFEKIPRKDAHFVKPQTIVEVEYRRWPADGLVQQASFKGIRTDKRPRDVVREDLAASVRSPHDRQPGKATR